MKLVSWNVNGIRACVKKGFLDYFKEVNADIFCIQETKMQEGQLSLELEGYHQYWNFAERKGYSGTAIFTKQKPMSVSYGIGDMNEEPEGRIITLEFEHYFLITMYTPNSKRDLARLDERLQWEEEIRAYITTLEKNKPVILCGDLNVAHQEIDLKNPKSNKGNSGFTDEEREKMSLLLNEGFVDSFRYLYPERKDVYSWWSYMSKVRERNIGWRIDYFIVSKTLTNRLIDSQIHCDILGSDHCPVLIEMDL
ncbi:exodeoxyribonuclease III [Metabacillus endolithicus]|uniref:Exodeoxyribonuclease III n=1 Tax=Metabacillus endolithicus TaxID=1535204 RepID=A0ABW5BXF1_9BACI|nr:exodeoxyribonuclease III [Metabacillus endolithicus]UPG64044.1 exodeoxyribonuclease III [Metabacillus endolithicus]